MATRRWWLALGAFCVVIVIAELPVLRAPFGDNRDGVNAGVWALASRELREHPRDSRLGAYAPHRIPTTYVNHPPLIVAELALAEAVGGERPWSTRLPPLLSTLASVILTAVLLRRAGARPWVALTATALTFGCPLVRTYGAMADTPIVGLPFGLAALVLWQRRRSDEQVAAWPWVVVVLLACLSSWLGWLMCGVIGCGLLLGRLWREAFAMAAGGATAAIAYLAWMWQTGRSTGDLMSIVLQRTDPQTGIGFVEPIARLLQSAYLPWTIVLAVPLAVVALFDVRFRPLALAAWTTALVWEIAFPFRAATEEFWLWWSLPAVAIGFGAGLELMARRLGTAGATIKPAVKAAVPVLCGVAGFGLFAPSGGWTTWAAGRDAGVALVRSRPPSSQVSAWVFTSDVDNLGWVGYQRRRDPEAVTTTSLDALATDHPSDLVLTPTAAAGRRSDLPAPRCLRPGERTGGYAVVTLDRLRSLLAAAPGCP